MHPNDVFVATRGDAQHAIGVGCAGVADSFFGDIAAHALGPALYDWVWQHRADPPVEREVAAWLQSQHAALAERVNSQGLSGLMNRGGPANLLQRRDQVGSQALAGFYILALDGSVSFYLLGPLRLNVYSTDLTAAPSAYPGNQGARWSSLNGLTGQPVARTLRPVQGVSLSTADLPAEWGGDFKLLYQPGSFSAAAQAAAATTSVGFAAAMMTRAWGRPRHRRRPSLTHRAAPPRCLAPRPAPPTWPPWPACAPLAPRAGRASRSPSGVAARRPPPRAAGRRARPGERRPGHGRQPGPGRRRPGRPL